MIYDMHVHTYLSGDSSVKPEDYLLWINSTLRERIGLEGIVFMEHHKNHEGSQAHDRDYKKLEKRFGIKILNGYEVETDYGHFLCYGQNGWLTRLKTENGRFSARELIEMAPMNSAIALPAHPGRKVTGLISYTEKLDMLPHFGVVETLNGGSTIEENHWAACFAGSKGIRGIGGSDAHYIMQLGKCLTRFTTYIENEEELIFYLRQGDYDAISLE